MGNAGRLNKRAMNRSTYLNPHGIGYICVSQHSTHAGSQEILYPEAFRA